MTIEQMRNDSATDDALKWLLNVPDRHSLSKALIMVALSGVESASSEELQVFVNDLGSNAETLRLARLLCEQKVTFRVDGNEVFYSLTETGGQDAGRPDGVVCEGDGNTAG